MDVLLVEDEPLVLEMVTEWLEDAGLRVASAATAEAALAWVSTISNAPPLPVLVTDVGLRPGGMDGISLVAQLRRRWPGLGVVMMTGHEPNLLRCVPRRQQERHLMKPFDPTALVRAIREVRAPDAASTR
jgi:CheY-like chemotaxis protein